MHPDEYQEAAKDTAVHPDGDEGILYLTLGLAGESGEVAENIKKWRRGEGDEDYLENIDDELGDVLWYLSRLADELGYDLSHVMYNNVEKLQGRAEEGSIHGHDKDDGGIVGPLTIESAEVNETVTKSGEDDD